MALARSGEGSASKQGKRVSWDGRGCNMAAKSWATPKISERQFFEDLKLDSAAFEGRDGGRFFQGGIFSHPKLVFPNMAVLIHCFPCNVSPLLDVIGMGKKNPR